MYSKACEGRPPSHPWLSNAFVHHRKANSDTRTAEATTKTTIRGGERTFTHHRMRNNNETYLGAINELLLTEKHHFASLLCVHRFQASVCMCAYLVFLIFYDNMCVRFCACVLTLLLKMSSKNRSYLDS